MALRWQPLIAEDHPLIVEDQKAKILHCPIQHMRWSCGTHNLSSKVNAVIQFSSPVPWSSPQSSPVIRHDQLHGQEPLVASNKFGVIVIVNTKQALYLLCSLAMNLTFHTIVYTEHLYHRPQKYLCVRVINYGF